MTSPGAIFAREFINITASDILLLILVAFFFLSGLAYKINAAREAWKIRDSIRKKKSAIQENTDQERRFKIELQNLMLSQNANRSEINRLRERKADMSHLPAKLEKELADLTSWCSDRNITVDFDRCIASKQPIRKK